VPQVWSQFETAEALYSCENVVWMKPNHLQVPQDEADAFAPCPNVIRSKPSESWFRGMDSDAEVESDEGTDMK
jgi:hypothetical protein